MKVVYRDGDYTKVVYGEVSYTADFVIVLDCDGNETRIGNSVIVSISNGGKNGR